MSKETERLRKHVRSYKSMSSHRQNCLDVCDENDLLRAALGKISMHGCIAPEDQCATVDIARAALAAVEKHDEVS